MFLSSTIVTIIINIHTLINQFFINKLLMLYVKLFAIRLSSFLEKIEEF